MTTNYPTLEDMAKEIADYYGVDNQEIIKRYREANEKFPGFVKWAHVTEEEWRRRGIDPSNKEAVEAFYKTTENLIFELMENWSLKKKNEMAFYVRDYLLRVGARRILSFGCGIGQDVIYYAEAGLKVDATDLPGRTFDFAKWRFRRRNLNIGLIDITSDDFLVDIYDAITSFEVFNVLVDPISSARYLYKHIRDEGLLIYSARFRNVYDLVPKQNERYADIFGMELERIGFGLVEKRYLWGTGEDARHLYIVRKRARLAQKGLKQ